ncbi:MFS transporter [Jiangella anatolica]|nr:MFS transporter [Jiangella anatolica]
MSAPTTSADVYTTLSAKARAMLAVLCAVLFLDALDVSMKGVALPDTGAALGMSTSTLQWVITGYVVGYGGFVLLGGRAVDLLGRRRMLLGALAVYVAASAVGGLADSGALLLVARFVSGVSAAISAPAAFSIITTGFAAGPVRNRALSIFTATGATGLALGLVAGGLLTELHWRLTYLAPAAFGLLALLAGVVLLPRSAPAPSGARRFDAGGALTITAAMLLVVYTLVEAPNVGWLSARSLLSFAAVALLVAAFAVVERRVEAPLVRLGLLRSGPLVRVAVGAASLLGPWIGVLFLVTIYLQDHRGWSALETGLAVAPVGVVGAILSPVLAPPLVARFGPPRVILAGQLTAVAAYVLLQFLGPSTGYTAVLLPAFVLIGVAFTLAYGPLTMAAAGAVDAADQGLAGGVVNTAFQLGAALGLSAVTAAYATGADVMDGLRSALVVPLVIAAIGALTAVRGVQRARTA